MSPQQLRSQADGVDSKIQQLTSTEQTEQQRLDDNISSYERQIESIGQKIDALRNVFEKQQRHWEIEKSKLASQATELRRKADEAEAREEQQRKLNAAAAAAATAVTLADDK